MSKSIADVTKIIVDFSNERGWVNENPSFLLNAIFIELGELAEHYQWQSDFTKIRAADKNTRTEIGFEFVDIIIYLFRFAERSGIDIEEYFDKKMPKLAEKFKVGADHSKAHKEYRKTGKNKLY